MSNSWSSKGIECKWEAETITMGNGGSKCVGSVVAAS